MNSKDVQWIERWYGSGDAKDIGEKLFHAVSMLEHEIWYECDAYGRSPTQDESEVLLKCYSILGGFYE